MAFLAPQSRLEPIQQNLVGEYGDVEHPGCLAGCAADPEPGESLTAHVSQGQNWTGSVFMLSRAGHWTKWMGWVTDRLKHEPAQAPAALRERGATL